MLEEIQPALIGSIAFFVVHLGFAARALLRPHREPSARFAWLVVILGAPVVGILAYLFLGETNIGRRRIERTKRVIGSLQPDPDDSQVAREADVPAAYGHLFQTGETVNGYRPLRGNRAVMMEDSNKTIDAMVADIDAARRHVHLMFYIWLDDCNGLKIVNALKRAAARGVSCRAMADGLGSRALIKSDHWREMTEAGVMTAVALPIGNPLLRPLNGRIDLRNHRKILVVDGRITYCGSQNCADPEFRVKAKYAPWVDVMMRFEGPVVRQNQALFVSDWMCHVDEDLHDLLEEKPEPIEGGFPAQVIATGPTVRHSAMPEVFESLMFSARREMFITTPYYVPDESMQSALCACARRGVATTIVFPARNDSFVVGAASHSYYAELLAAGVRIMEFHGGLLHAKSLTVDGVVTLIGSANMDRRSFDLNYENNILLMDAEVTRAMRARQDQYLSQSTEVTSEMVDQWWIGRRLLNNTIAMLGPVL